MISVELPEDMERDLNQKKEAGYYSSLAEVVREALREYLERENRDRFTARDRMIAELVSQGRVSGTDAGDDLKDEIREALEDMKSEADLHTLEEARAVIRAED